MLQLEEFCWEFWNWSIRAKSSFFISNTLPKVLRFHFLRADLVRLSFEVREYGALPKREKFRIFQQHFGWRIQESTSIQNGMDGDERLRRSGVEKERFVIILECSEISNWSIWEEKALGRSGQATIKSLLDVLTIDSLVVPSKRMTHKTQVNEAKFSDEVGENRCTTTRRERVSP